jgi:hypothetical protein
VAIIAKEEEGEGKVKGGIALEVTFENIKNDPSTYLREK